MEQPASLTRDELDLCVQMTRQHDRDLYLADLLLEGETRSAAMVLHAFHGEMIHVAANTREPMAGEIRLQWWREVLLGERATEAQGNPLARALLHVIGEHKLPVTAFVEKVDAHIFDLYQDPMESWPMVEGYCGATRSILFQLLALIDGHEVSAKLADASGHAGMAIGLCTIIERAAHHRARGQKYIPPVDIGSANPQASMDPTDIDSTHLASIDAVLDRAQDHYDKAIAAISALDRPVRTTFLPLSVIPYYLQRQRTHRTKVLSGLPGTQQWRKQWILWRASRRSPFRG